MILQILFSIFSVGIIGFILYLRITRKVYDIVLDEEFIAEHFVYFTGLFIISMITTILSILILVKKNTQNNFLVAVKQIITKYNIFYKAYGIIFELLGPNYTRHLVFFSKYVLKLNKHIKEAIMVMVIILPKVLIIMVFYLEIYHRHLNNYYYVLLLLLIPMFFRFLLFILEDIGPRVLPQLEELLVFESETLSKEQKVKSLTIKFRPEIKDLSLDHFLNNFYYPILFISGEMALNIMPKYYKILFTVSLLYNVFQLLGWFYILVIGLF